MLGTAAADVFKKSGPTCMGGKIPRPVITEQKCARAIQFLTRNIYAYLLGGGESRNIGKFLMGLKQRKIAHLC